jgi:hypothetical protein
MRRLRSILCVSLVASGAVFLGQAGAASAKVCSLAGSGGSCGTGHGSVYSGEVFGALAELKKFTISSKFIFLSCPESEFAGEVNGETGAGSIFALVLRSCAANIGKCTKAHASASSSPWPTSVTVSTAPDGTMTMEKVQFEYVCEGITCIYGTAKAGTKGEIVVKGGQTGEIVATEVPAVIETGSSMFCSTTATWSGDWKIKTPDSYFVT